ncbi:MAG: tryptophan synthase subunit alpha [Erysipelotrichaceae bacterium]|nr:tryptophan synthase subunit alpha [Erysipelotrichaceae bacterium]
MSRIHEAFENKKAFIPFITCGDPDLETTAAIVKAMVQNGADLIELGIPFSDPTAEGPVIQEADNRALKGGVNTEKILAVAKELRKEISVPMVFMTYANVVYSYGAEKFLSVAKEAEIDGLILPDVPFEEKEEFASLCEEYGLDLISMIAPTSKERIRMIAKEAKGFLYVVSSLGVTGVRSQINTDIASLISEVRAVTDLPCAVGFGISAPEQAARMASLSDGAIVGSAIVRIIAEHGKDSPEAVATFVKEMSTAVHQIR